MVTSRSIFPVIAIVLTEQTTLAPAATWLSSNGGTWGVAANWSTGNVPDTSSEDATISLGGNVLLDADYTIGSLTLNNSVIAGGSRTLTAGSFSWTRGVLGGDGHTVVTGDATLAAAANLVVSFRTLTLQGNTVYRGGSPSANSGLYMQDGATINAAGTFSITDDSSVIGAGPDNTFRVSGSLTKTGGSGTSSVLGVVNTGTIKVNSNTLLLYMRDNATSTGAFSTAAGTTLKITGGPHTFASGATFSGTDIRFTDFGIFNASGLVAAASGSVVSLNGGPSYAGGVHLGGTGTWQFDNFIWTGGTMQDAGITTVAGSTTIAPETTATPLTLTGRTLNLQAVSTYSGALSSGGLKLENGGVINNTGAFSITDDSSIFGDTSAANAFNNSGTLTKTGGTGTSSVAALVNAGTVNVNSGTLNTILRGGASSTGNFNFASGTTLSLSSAGTHTLTAAATLDGAGKLRFTGGTINVEGVRSFAYPVAVADGTVNFNASTVFISPLSVGGTANFVGVATLNGGLTLTNTLGGGGTVDTPTLAWNSGTMNGGGITNVSGNATLSSNAATVVLSGRMLSLHGHTTQSSTGNFGLSLQNGAVLDNTGSYAVTDDSGIAGNGSAGNAFNNVGTLTKTGGTGTSTVAALVNTGTVAAASGTLSAVLKNAGTTSTGAFIAMPGRTLRLSSDSGPLALPAAGTLGGGGTIDFIGNAGVAGTVMADGTGLSVATASNTLTVTGVIVDPPAPAVAVGLVKLGAGQLTLTGVNTYTGPTTVIGGTLAATDGVGLPAASALALSNGTLASSGTFTRSLGVHAGEVTLAGAVGFAALGGDLVVALGGTASTTPVTVGQAGFTPTTLSINNGIGTGAVDFRNSIDLAGATNFVINVPNGAATLSGNLTDSVSVGTVDKSGAGLLTLTGNNTYSGTTSITGGTLRASGASLSNANISFNGGLLGTTGTFARSLGTGAGQVQFALGGVGGFSAEGGDLTISLPNNGPLVWGTTPGFNPAAVIIGGPLATHTTTLTSDINLSTANAAATRTLLTRGGTAVLSGVISNTGAAQGTLAIGGNGAGGTLTLSGSNTYGGTTLIDSGVVGAATVRAINSSAFGSSTIQFQTGSNAATGRLELANTITVNNNINLTGRSNLSAALANVSDNNTLGGTVNLGSGGNAFIIQSDAGLLTLTGAAGSSAGTAVRGGTAVTGPRIVTLQGAGDGVVSGLIANNAAVLSVFKAGAGRWTLSAVNTFTGPVSLFGGLLSTNNLTKGGSTSGLGASTNAAGNVQFIGGGLQYTGTAVVTDRLVTIGAGGGTLDASGSGAVVFSNTGANVTVDGPTNGTTIGGKSVTVTAGNLAGLVVGQSVSGPGFSTGTTVTAINYNAGTFTISNSAAAGTGIALTFGRTAARTLTLTGADTVDNTIAGTLSDSAAGTVLGVTKTGAGTWVLSGANTYTGPTSVLGGTLRIAKASAVGNLLSSATGGVILGNDGGKLVLNYTGGGSPAGLIRTILEGEAAGNFAAGRIRSNLTGNHTIGYGDDGTGVTVRVTLFGDADLDGGVSINDFNALASNFGQTGGRVWTQGDFDYDGGVSINDFNLLAAGFGQSLPASSEMWAGLLAFAAAHDDLTAFEAVTGVPEPTGLGLIAAGATLGLRRRHRLPTTPFVRY